MGPVGSAYTICMMMVYLPLGCLLVLFTVPAMIAYVWLAGALAVVGRASQEIVVRFAADLLPWLRGKAGYDSPMAEAQDAAQAKLHLAKLTEAKNWGDDDAAVMASYRSEMECFKATGVPREAWDNYAASSCLFTPFLVLLPPIAARLYAGRGYWHAVAQTLGERHLAAYIGCSAASVTSKAQFLWLLL